MGGETLRCMVQNRREKVLPISKRKKKVLEASNLLSPAKLRPDEEDLCINLDKFYEYYKIGKKASEFYRGAIFASREETKSNPDWLAQATHSLREILYPFYSSKDNRIKEKKISAFRKYGSIGVELIKKPEIGKFWGKLNRITHHQDEDDFDNLRQEFVRIISKALAHQVDIHRMIDTILLKDPASVKKNEQFLSEVNDIISINPDSRQYFFTKVTEKWLDWLWKNGFLDLIKKRAEDPTRYGYIMPELNYLVRIAAKVPQKIIGILLDENVAATQNNFNPEVIDRFVWICSILPAEHLRKVVKNIRKYKWIPLMASFNPWGLEYEKMLRTLAGAKDWKSILVLADSILSLRPGKEYLENKDHIGLFSPFYLQEISSTKVFNYLATIDEEFVEKALALVIEKMNHLVLLGDKSDNRSEFSIIDPFPFIEIDFFNLDISGEMRTSTTEAARELILVVKVLSQRLIEKRCSENEYIRRIYKKYFMNLPDSRLIWRFRLYVLSLCPSVFQRELKQSFSRLICVMKEGKPYSEITSGTEYKQTLRLCFGTLDDKYQREYVKSIFLYFGKKHKDEYYEKMRKMTGWQILSSICENLTKKEREKCENIFENKCDPDYKPKPPISEIKVGWVAARGPISQQELGQLLVNEIVQKLKKEWSPQELSKVRAGEDLWEPLNAEGVGDMLGRDIAKRPQDYVNNSCLFFERDIIDEHYSYAFLVGMKEAIRADRSLVATINWDDMIELLDGIKQSGEVKPFDHQTRERETYGTWLASWGAVHSAMADVLYELLNTKKGSEIRFQNYRGKILGVIGYLLAHPNPLPKDEELETAVIRISNPEGEHDLVSNPFTIAINSVRGKAFQAFVLFLYQDELKTRESKNKIAPDVKELYERVLNKEKTRAIMFLFGHYLPSFYYRESRWILKLLPVIFPNETEKKHLYVAAWEGYLTNNLYEEIFFEPAFQKLYNRGLSLTGNEDPKREYFKELDEGIATHLALAFIVYHKKIDFENPLFKELWKKNIEKQAKFVSFIGRIFISGENEIINKLIENEAECRERLEKIWEWILKNHSDPKLFVEFGLWINIEKKIFNTVWLAHQIKETLKKSEGILEWDLGLSKAILQLVKDAPLEGLDIARMYLLEGGVRGGRMRMPFYLRHIDEWFEAMKVLYENPETRDGVYSLINDLILEGGRNFWRFKEILADY
jgi:hypothetical protein